MATINIRVDGVIYDTVFCTAFIGYNKKTDREYIRNSA